jgi:hypothetical protein
VNVKDMGTELEALKEAYIELEEQRDAVRDIHTTAIKEFEGRVRELT